MRSIRMRLRTVGCPMNSTTDNSKLVPLKWFVFIIKYLAITCGRMISAPTDLYKKKRQHNFCTVLVGADDGARTRYLHLGKVALYQMSYIRILLVPPGGIEPPTRGFSVPCSTD